MSDKIIIPTQDEYKHYVKGVGFLPNPIARFGVPKEYDGRKDRKVIGTSGHTRFWEEQFNYCVNGYETGGEFIPGPYYYYLNFCYISTLERGNHHPDFVDVDWELFKLFEEVKKKNKGIILLKARRKGVSEKLKGIIGHGLRFEPYGYRAGVIAGKSDYSELLFNKIKQHNSDVRPEFRLHASINKSEEYKVGYEEETENGFIESGSGNSVRCATMNTNPNVFKGEKFNIVAFEESGENELLVKGYNATKDCFMVGGVMKGTSLVFGTGGDITSSSKGFQEMWSEADKYHLVRFRIHAPRMYIGCFVGSRGTDGKLLEDCPNILKNPKYANLKKEQLLGCEDTERSLEKIMLERKFLQESNDTQKIFDNLQNNPINDNEAFLKFSGNQFNAQKLSEQHYKNVANKSDHYRHYILDWKRDAQNNPLLPLQIDEDKIREATELERTESIMIAYKPVKGVKNLYTAGIDGYDIDVSLSSKSLGGMCVRARESHVLTSDRYTNCPHAIIRQRPHRKEIFWENCLKLAVYYDLVCDSRGGNVMVDYAKPGVIEYFKRMGGRKYLALRPQSLESEHSEQVHEFGVNLVPRARNTMISRMQSDIEDNAHKIVFDILTQELMDFDERAKVSDNDVADAYGLALLREMDMNRMPEAFNVSDNYDPYPVAQYSEGNSSIVRAEAFVNKNNLTHKNNKPITDPMTLYLMNGNFD